MNNEDNKKTANAISFPLEFCLYGAVWIFILPSPLKRRLRKNSILFTNFLPVENFLNINNNHWACQGFLA
jgi:hypothetical protein